MKVCKVIRFEINQLIAIINIPYFKPYKHVPEDPVEHVCLWYNGSQGQCLAGQGEGHCVSRSLSDMCHHDPDILNTCHAFKSPKIKVDSVFNS